MQPVSECAHCLGIVQAKDVDSDVFCAEVNTVSSAGRTDLAQAHSGPSTKQLASCECPGPAMTDKHKKKQQIWLI